MGSGDSLEGNRRQPRQRLRIQAIVLAPVFPDQTHVTPMRHDRKHVLQTVVRLVVCLSGTCEVIRFRRNSRIRFDSFSSCQQLC